MKKEDLVIGRQYFFNGEWITFIGKGGGCDFMFEGKTKSYGFSLEMVEALANNWRQSDSE